MTSSLPDDAKSIISMQELDPSPVDDSTSDLDDLENGQFIPKPDEPQKRTCGFPSLSPSLLGYTVTAGTHYVCSPLCRVTVGVMCL